MAKSLNKVVLIGNVGQDPEVRQMQDGKEMATLSLATSEGWKDKGTGEWQEKTEWHRVVIFVQPLIAVVRGHVHKGTKLYLEGNIQTRKWQSPSGEDRYSTEVVLNPYTSTLIILDKAASEHNQEAKHNQVTQPGEDEILF